MADKILLIEDDELFQELTGKFLRDHGYEVVIASDGEEGVEKALANRYDAIIVDLMMPRMHGFEVIQRLRDNLSTVRTPILVHSAKIYESDQRKALTLGANAFLQKPLRPNDIRDALQRQLNFVRVTFWGVRGSIAAPGRDTVRYGGNTPCVTISHGPHTLLLDAGTGIRRLGLILQAEARGGPVECDLLITHTHWDHIQGFPFFGPAFVPQNTVHIYGPATAGKPLDKVLTGQMDPEYFPVGLSQMGAKIICDQLRGEPFQVGPFDISYMYMNHPGVTLGYRLEAGGHVVVYATDTEPYHRMLPRRGHAAEQEGEAFGRACDEALVEFARDADLYIADSQYSPEDYAKKTGWGHSCYLDAAEVAIQAAVKRLVLFSHDPMHDDDALDHKLEVVRAYVAERAPGIEVSAAADCSVVRLPL